MKRKTRNMVGMMTAAMSLLLLGAPSAAWACPPPIAYVGPGAGLSMLGALATVIGVLGLGLLGPLLYPVVAIRRWCYKRHDPRPDDP